MKVWAAMVGFMNRISWPIGLTFSGALLLLILIVWTKTPDFDIAAGIVPWALPLAMFLLAAGGISLFIGISWGLIAGVSKLARRMRKTLIVASSDGGQLS